MIDFRYHLVSLISVFLALAVGIALGAGPLQESIGDTLTGQVDQLRAERERLSTELGVAQADLAELRAALDDVAPELLDEVLQGRRVAVVEVADVAPEVLEGVTGRLEQAGATVTATVQVTPDWTDPARTTFRQTLAGTLMGYLDPRPAADAGADQELAEALAQGLTSAQPGDPDALSEPASILLQLLQEAGLVALQGDVTTPADMVVVLSGPTVSVEEVQTAQDELAGQAPEDIAQEEARLEALIDATVGIAAAAQLRSAGTVVAGGEMVQPSALTALRAGDVAVEVSTVESVHEIAGQIAVPMALAAHVSGMVGHYGASPAADSFMPPRMVLPPVQSGPPEAPATGEVTGQAAEGARQDAEVRG